MGKTGSKMIWQVQLVAWRAREEERGGSAEEEEEQQQEEEKEEVLRPVGYKEQKQENEKGGKDVHYFTALPAMQQ